MVEKRGAHVFVCECLFEFIVGHKAHARFDRISDNESCAASIHPAYALRAQRLADNHEWRLALDVAALDAIFFVASVKRREKINTHFRRIVSVS